MMVQNLDRVSLKLPIARRWRIAQEKYFGTVQKSRQGARGQILATSSRLNLPMICALGRDQFREAPLRPSRYFEELFARVLPAR